MSRRNRKKRKQIAHQMQMDYQRIEQLRRLYGYDPERHQIVQRRFYSQARFIYLCLWIQNWVEALSCFDVVSYGVARINIGGYVLRMITESED